MPPMSTSGTIQEVIREVQIRALEGPDDFQKAEQVQLETWGYSERDVVPSAIFAVARNFGGQALGAFYKSRMVGFALSVGAVGTGHLHFHSHMVAVVPEYQGQGLGLRIKLSQREDALHRAIDQIVWTFDPLQVRNAYFNIAKLGGVGVQYVPNLYGKTSSPLHGGMPTDRLIIEWNLQSSRVLQALNSKRDEPDPNAVRVAIPLIPDDLPIAERVARQAGLRERLMPLMSEGYVITGLERGGETASYLLEIKSDV